jgi:hypothetical protein
MNKQQRITYELSIIVVWACTMIGFLFLLFSEVQAGEKRNNINSGSDTTTPYVLYTDDPVDGQVLRWVTPDVQPNPGMKLYQVWFLVMGAGIGFLGIYFKLDEMLKAIKQLKKE